MMNFKGLSRIIGVMAVVLMVLAGAAQAAESRFFSELSDVPVMPGLYELTRETVVFDKPEGRIVECAAVAEKAQLSEIIDFYVDILPRLGWTRLGGENAAASFLRDGEKLSLRLDRRAGLNIVHFSLSPAP